MKTLSITPWNLDISSIKKDTSRRTFFNLAGEAPIRYANKLLCGQTLGNGLLYSCDTHKENTKSWPDLHIICWPESKDFLKLKQTFDEIAFPRHLDNLLIFRLQLLQSFYRAWLLPLPLWSNSLRVTWSAASQAGSPKNPHQIKHNAQLWGCEYFLRLHPVSFSSQQSCVGFSVLFVCLGTLSSSLNC